MLSIFSGVKYKVAQCVISIEQNVEELSECSLNINKGLFHVLVKNLNCYGLPDRNKIHSDSLTLKYINISAMSDIFG